MHIAFMCVHVCMCTYTWRYVWHMNVGALCMYLCGRVCPCGHVICMCEYVYMWVACRQAHGMHVCMWSIGLWSFFMQLCDVPVALLRIGQCMQPGYLPLLSPSAAFSTSLAHSNATLDQDTGGPAHAGDHLVTCGERSPFPTRLCVDVPPSPTQYKHPRPP